MLHVRRGVAPVFFVPAGVVAILAALTLHALAQPASRPPNTPRPGLEDPSQDAAQGEVRGRPVRRAGPRPANTMPNFDNPETTALPSLTAPGTSSTATLLRSTAAGTSVRSSATTGSAEAATAKPVSAAPAAPVTPAAAPPRNPLLRIPD